MNIPTVILPCGSKVVCGIAWTEHGNPESGWQLLNDAGYAIAYGHVSGGKVTRFASADITAQQHGEFTDLLASVAKEQSVA